VSRSTELQQKSFDVPDGGHGRQPRIWIVEDSPTEAQLIEAALGPRYRFEQFRDGSSVIERIASSGKLPDLVLLDGVMPGMSGVEVCRFLRSHPNTAELPVILVTASRVETSDIVEGLRVGANDYIPKPFADAELRARVEAVLRAKELADASARERRHLAAIARLGRALFDAGPSVPKIFEELATTLNDLITDGCSVLTLPGELPPIAVSRHRAERSGTALAEISKLADPTTYTFETQEDALARLPPAYHRYVKEFGLRALAILPFPMFAPIQGVVTVTRDGNSEPFEEEDVSTIQTCIEYAALAVQNALRFETERSARAQLDSVLLHLPIGIIAADREGRIEIVNSTADSLVPGLGGARTLAGINELAMWTTLDGGPIDWTRLDPRVQLMMNPTTRSRTFLVSTVPFAGDAGQAIALVDITAEYAIRQERERLAQFQQELLGIVGHDLRTPLAAIVLGLETLKLRTDGSASVQGILKRMESSSTRMERIVDLLLDVTRARLGQGIPIRRRAMRISTLVSSVIDDIRGAHPSATFELGLDQDVEGNWDPERLAQVLSNLARNAVSYGKDNAPVQIRVTTIGDDVVLSVRNEVRGAPIPPATLAKIFDPFKRGEVADTTSRGLGLGLYIVHEIVRSHGGGVHARSDEAGTVFEVRLPLAGD
jgi:sigma-B regulation protein RsbU (phosphoserine phosphatase)